MDDMKVLPKGTVLKSNSREYTVIGTLGAGGFGITYLVETKVQVQNISASIRMAVKEHFISSLCERDGVSHQISFSNPVEDTVVRARRAFLKEAQRLQSLGIEHHNIVKINEVFETNNTAYYVMEYLEGETLQEYVRSRGSLSYDETLSLMRPIIDAVATLHASHITHYDIKPGNIILAHEADGTVRPVLIDFGLSKHYDKEGLDTSTLNAPGYSPGYAPLEQYAGLKQYTPQADVYALAATMYFCLTGHKPEAADSFEADSLAVTLDGKAPRPFIEKLRRAMAYSKNQRTPDAGTFFREIYDSEPVEDDSTRINISENTEMIASKPAEPVKTTPQPTPVQYAEPEEEPIEKKSNHKWLWLMIGAVIVCAIGAFLWFGYGGGDSTEQQPTDSLSAGVPSEEEFLAKAYEKYDVVGDITEDGALVGKDGNIGFIDRQGNEIFACGEYDVVYEFSEGMVAVKKDGKRGYIDTNRNIVIPLIYDKVGEFSEGLAPVGKDGKWGYLDKNGNIVIPLMYEWAESFSEGLARVEKDGKLEVIDKNGNVVIPLIYDRVGEFSEGLAMVRKDYKYGYIDKNGNVVIPLMFDDAYSFAEGLAPVKKDDKWGYIDKNGNVVIPLIYAYAHSFSDGLAVVVEEDGKEVYIDKNGNVVIPFIYDDYRNFSEGLALVGKDNKYGYIDKNGNFVIPLIYDYACPFSDGLALVRKDDKFGYIDKRGKVMWEK